MTSRFVSIESLQPKRLHALAKRCIRNLMGSLGLPSTGVVFGLWSTKEAGSPSQLSPSFKERQVPRPGTLELLPLHILGAAGLPRASLMFLSYGISHS